MVPCSSIFCESIRNNYSFCGAPHFETDIYSGTLIQIMLRAVFSRRVYLQPNHAACSPATVQILVACGNALQTNFGAPRIKLEDVRPGPCETLFV